MKKLINKILLISAGSILFYSCKKDLQQTFLVTGNGPTLAASSTTLVLAAPGTDTSETLSWSATQYGYSAAVNYTIQIAKAGTNFASPKEIVAGPVLVKKFASSDLNTIAIILGLAFGSPGQLDIRVKSSISDALTPVYSNKVTVSITPYQVIINYPSMWVPGDYQGWDPGSAPKISLFGTNSDYEGYLNVPSGGTYQFKLTSEADWSGTNYGYATGTTSGNTVSGTLSTSGSAGNLYFPNGGYFVVRANPTTLTWSVKQKTWGIIGDAPIASNNWSNDVPMTYDAVNKVWTVTTSFQAGSFKFRANGDWSDGTNNFGDDGADLILDYGGANISVTSAGTHTITLDLHIPGNYTYKIQ